MAALDVGVAVRIARVIDEAGIVTVECGVDDPFAAQREQKGVMPGVALVGIAPIGLHVADLLAGVLDEAGPLRNILARERSEALNP